MIKRVIGVWPKRPHRGCDDMCERCSDAMDALNEDLSPLVTAGIDAFWKVIESKFPGLRSEHQRGCEFSDQSLYDSAAEAVLDRAFERVNENRPLLKRSRRPTRRSFDESLYMDVCGVGTELAKSKEGTTQ